MSILTNHTCSCSNCELDSTASNLTGKGKGTTFQLSNSQNKKISKYVVDHCLLRDYMKDEKCDYLFTVNGDNVVFLVECKGSDVLKAVSQIDSTLTILESELQNQTVKGRIVTTKTPSPALKSRAISLLRERLNKELRIKSQLLKEEI